MTQLGAIDMLASIAGVALAWVMLFKLNLWLFSFANITPFISWIFLPAAVRLLAVMWLGWRGAAGLFIGALITCNPVLGENLTSALALSAVSALGSVVAVDCCMRWFKLPPSLNGLGASKLLGFAVAGAVCNVLPTNLTLYLAGQADAGSAEMLPMFVGDITGTLLILYLVALLLRLVPSQQS